VQYISTRGGMEPTDFCETLLEGLAPDGGLAIPTQLPTVDPSTLESWRGLDYADLASEVIGLFATDIPRDDLSAMTHAAYSADKFPGGIVPLRDIDGGITLVGLSEGPTLAFKDMAMQFLGQVMEYALERRGTTLNIVGATSGDTGSAAEQAFRGKKHINVFMLSPQGRMSGFQRAQMFSLQDENIHNLAIEGVFDDCQDIVKAVSNDHAFKAQYKIGTVNSINWARLLAQVVYYFAGYIQATESNAQKVSFAVPSGNFGNVCAGHVARQMGLPIDRLIVATNENDVLDEFFRTGVYQVRGSAQTYETSSPSMDISKASNFERFVFDLLGRDGAATRALFEDGVGRQGRFDLSGNPAFKDAAARYGFVSGKSTHADRLATIKDTWERFGQIIDTHTADGVKVARALRGDPAVPMVVLETALPIKFAATIEEALGRAPDRPAKFEGIEALPKRVTVLPADAQQVKAYIATHCD
jgi:threonine synthase